MSKEEFLKRIRVELKQNEKTTQRDELIEGVKVVFTGKKEIIPHVDINPFYQMRNRIRRIRIFIY